MRCNRMTIRAIFSRATNLNSRFEAIHLLLLPLVLCKTIRNKTKPPSSQVICFIKCLWLNVCVARRDKWDVLHVVLSHLFSDLICLLFDFSESWNIDSIILFLKWSITHESCGLFVFRANFLNNENVDYKQTMHNRQQLRFCWIEQTTANRETDWEKKKEKKNKITMVIVP